VRDGVGLGGGEPIHHVRVAGPVLQFGFHSLGNLMAIALHVRHIAMDRRMGSAVPKPETVQLAMKVCEGYSFRTATARSARVWSSPRAALG
jgi:hypothetical protein